MKRENLCGSFQMSRLGFKLRYWRAFLDGDGGCAGRRKRLAAFTGFLTRYQRHPTEGAATSWPIQRILAGSSAPHDRDDKQGQPCYYCEPIAYLNRKIANYSTAVFTNKWSALVVCVRHRRAVEEPVIN